MFNKLDLDHDANIISNNGIKHCIYDQVYNDQIYKFKIVKYQTYFNKNIENDISKLNETIDSYYKINNIIKEKINLIIVSPV